MWPMYGQIDVKNITSQAPRTYIDLHNFICYSSIGSKPIE